VKITFVPVVWEDYRYWQITDRKILKRINQLIDDITRDDPFTGIGKPEPLRHHLSGAWSRRINDEHRLVYLVQDDNLVILAARYHYNK
jgi:toxin YoeB